MPADDPPAAGGLAAAVAEAAVPGTGAAAGSRDSISAEVAWSIVQPRMRA